MADTTKIAQWREWRKRCAIAKCRAKTANALRSYARQRFTYFLMNLANDVAFDINVPEADECWHLLESYLCVSRPRTGRRYKEWLFARLARSSDDPIDVVQGGATLVLRSVVRDWFYEQSPPKIVSLYAPLGSGIPSPAELLPDPTPQRHDDWEIRDAARAAARNVSLRLDRSTRLVLLARASGIPLFHPGVLQYIGIGHSKASEIPKTILTALADHVRRKWRREPQNWQMRVTFAAYQEIVSGVMARWDSGRARDQLARLVQRARSCKKVAAGKSHSSTKAHESTPS